MARGPTSFVLFLSLFSSRTQPLDICVLHFGYLLFFLLLTCPCFCCPLSAIFISSLISHLAVRWCAVPTGRSSCPGVASRIGSQDGNQQHPSIASLISILRHHDSKLTLLQHTHLREPKRGVATWGLAALWLRPSPQIRWRRICIHALITARKEEC